jgi:integrase
VKIDQAVGHEPKARKTRRTKLTDRYLKSLKPAADGRSHEVMDTVVDRMGVRVTGTAAQPVLSFILYTRFPDFTGALKKAPTRRALGAYIEPPEVEPEQGPTVEELLELDTLTLAEARLKAQEWLRMIARGVDPGAETARRKQAKIENRKNTFDVVFEAFKIEKLATERKGEEVGRDIENNFLPAWKERPIMEITELDVLAVINAKKKTAPSQARNLLGEIRRLFDWAIEQRVYGITVNPCRNLKPAKIIGKKKKRQRILTEDELFALWRAAKRMPYPAGPVYRMLMLTALRLNEPTDASWPELNPAVVRALRQRKKNEPVDWTRLKPDELAWVIPAERMKGENDEARPHLVSLTPDILQILESLPLFNKGDFLFSTTFGKKPVCIGDKIKKEVDARMLRTLKALARRRGDDPAKVQLAHWVNQDIRRTVRSNLSRLRVTEEAREAVVAHARPGIKGVYDVHDYADEKREALELWATRLRSIVEPKPSTDNVIQLEAARAG